MKFVSVRDLRGRPTAVWTTLAREGELILTSNGKPIAILSTVSEDTLEASLAAIRQARAIAAVQAIQCRSSRSAAGRLTEREIEAEIAAVRRARRR